MVVIGQDVLTAAGRKNTPVRKWLAEWLATAQQTDWHGLEDVRRQYPSADGVKLASGTIVTVFDVKGNSYRLLTVIYFDAATVEALEVITHAEYDKNLWKARY